MAIGLQVMIIFIHQSFCCQKIDKTKTTTNFPVPSKTFSNCSFCPTKNAQPKGIQFTMTVKLRKACTSKFLLEK